MADGETPGRRWTSGLAVVAQGGASGPLSPIRTRVQAQGRPRMIKLSLGASPVWQDGEPKHSFRNLGVRVEVQMPSAALRPTFSPPACWCSILLMSARGEAVAASESTR